MSEPDWARLARDVAERGDAAATALADGTSAGAARAALVSALAAALHLPDPAPPSADETERALAAVLDRRAITVHPLASRARPFAPTVWRAAAAILAVAGGAFWWRTTARDHAARPVSVAVGATRAGQLDSLRLPDGTRVVLGPASALETAAGFASGDRTVRLRGEAYFDVVHDDAHPFVVRTAAGVVRDVGTSFAVRDDSASGLVVVVQAGVVMVGRDTAAAGVVLHAGDRATLLAEGAPRVERGGATAADVDWMRGRLVLRDAGVAEVRDAMRRWYGLEVRIEDSLLSSRRVTATFEREAGVDAARVIAAAMGGVARAVGDTVFIARAPAPVPR